MFRSKITGLGFFVPENIVSNDDLSKLMETSDDWISERTGIKNRRWVNDKKLTLDQLIKLLCENPVSVFGIKNKGFIKKDYDADFTIIDMSRTIEIKNENIHSKCGWSPFDGYKFKGSPVYTIINGDIKMKEDEILGDPSGKPILFD